MREPFEGKTEELSDRVVAAQLNYDLAGRTIVRCEVTTINNRRSVNLVFDTEQSFELSGLEEISWSPGDPN